MGKRRAEEARHWLLTGEFWNHSWVTTIGGGLVVLAVMQWGVPVASKLPGAVGEMAAGLDWEPGPAMTALPAMGTVVAIRMMSEQLLSRSRAKLRRAEAQHEAARRHPPEYHI